MQWTDSLKRKSRALQPWQRSADGFTLIEVMIALAIIAIVLGLASGGSIRNWLTQRGLSTAVEQLYSDMQRARLLAVKEHANCTLTIDAPGANQYSLSLNNQVIDLAQYRGNVSFISASSSASITFTPWGTCDAGEIRLTSQGNPATYRLRTSGAGGISKQVWTGAKWVSPGV